MSPTTAVVLFGCSVLQHLATRELYAISKELNVRAETLIEQYSPDLTPAFKEWLVAELRKHCELEQRSAQAAPAVHPSADSAAAVPSRPAQQMPQQQQENAVAAGAPAAAAATGRGGGGSGLEALRARMNQLQAKGNPLAPAPVPAHGSAPGALVGASSCSSLPAMAKAADMAAPVLDTVNAISDGGIGVGSAAAAGQQPGGGRSIDEIKNRFHSMHLTGQ
jgi:hypothetical protein